MSRPVLATYVALIDQYRGPINGTAVKLDPPAILNLTQVGDKVAVEVKMPEPVSYELIDPQAIGVGFFSEKHKLLLILSIPGSPYTRKRGEEFVVNSRYTIIKGIPKKTS